MEVIPSSGPATGLCSHLSNPSCLRHQSLSHQSPLWAPTLTGPISQLLAPFLLLPIISFARECLCVWSICECTHSVQPLCQTGKSRGTDCCPSCFLPVPSVHPVSTAIKLPAVTLFPLQGLRVSKSGEIVPRFFIQASPHWIHYGQASEGACGILGG